jgi:hypothetical protein
VAAARFARRGVLIEEANMTNVSHSIQTMAAVLALLFFTFTGPLNAQEAKAPEAAWQTVISGQIEAFRAGDGVTALSFAGSGFQGRYSNPDVFISDIARSGYAPIVNSRSHSFGSFDKLNETVVMQMVKFVGPDQLLYEAIYQMALEKDGWRVQGVALKQQEGISV